eukprot:CAMPEP_0198541934 /NCGR_PEP_ID=MMETSP1462-20131121/55649_1 /TAXON_ID=1333877 /ORGANISM="Brandtodinium nutriculum, Strain RCC3387" /LENGTH=48 /DNA_ID= /DNA_START= /DNA_END= /DNA_ORIENTATION=
MRPARPALAPGAARTPRAQAGTPQAGSVPAPPWRGRKAATPPRRAGSQ